MPLAGLFGDSLSLPLRGAHPLVRACHVSQNLYFFKTVRCLTLSHQVSPHLGHCTWEAYRMDCDEANSCLEIASRSNRSRWPTGNCSSLILGKDRRSSVALFRSRLNRTCVGVCSITLCTQLVAFDGESSPSTVRHNDSRIMQIHFFPLV